jgi:hypothetical protein
MVGKREVEPPHPHAQGGAIRTSSGLLAANLPLLPRRFQFPVPHRVDLLLPPSQHVLRRDVARGAVQAHVVVVVNVSAYQTPGIL